MSYCTNVSCNQPENHDHAKFCTSCGSVLLLKDRYRPLKIIGCGGFGRTFLAIDEYLPSQAQCVVKQLCFPKENAANFNKAVELFHQEAVRLEELGQHPQIPDLKAHFEQDNQLYLVQELICGETLEQALQKQTGVGCNVFKEEQIWQLLNDLLLVLNFIHAHHVIHRDIKPANIIRRHDGKLVLIDFGVAKLITATAIMHTGTAVGSPEYVAPEQMRGKALPASDLYSIGVTCLHLLTGVSPFDLFDIVNDRWVWQDYLLLENQVSYRLAQILNKLIQSALSQRYKSAIEVLQEIKQPVTAKKPLNHSAGFFSKVLQPLNQQQKDILSLQLGINYTELHDLLADRKWQQADKETWILMCRLLAKPLGSYLGSYDIDKLPCQDLLMIDQLWVKYSSGRFGFSIQKQIYESVESDYGSFCDRVGWLIYNPTSPTGGLQFNFSAPIGHLPSRIWVGGSQWWKHAAALAAKLALCGL